MTATAKVQFFPVSFLPDLGPAWYLNPGLLTSVTDLVPSKRATYKTFACIAANGFNNATFAEATYGIAKHGQILKKTDGTSRLIVGTGGGSKSRLLEIVSDSFVDRSLGGSDYSLTSDGDETWTLAQYGNVTLATNDLDAVQASTTGAFAALAGSPPKAKIVRTQYQQVLLFNYNDGTRYGDGWWCSALGNHTSWTPSVATQAANGRLLATPGEIRAAEPMRDGMVVYKDDSIYYGTYVGPDIIWEWRLISDQIGCGSPNGVAIVNGVHYFIHRTGVYAFDGAQIRAIGNGVNRYIFDTLVKQRYYGRLQAVYDEYESVVWWFAEKESPSQAKSVGFALNLTTGKFGVATTLYDSGTCRCVIRATLSDIGGWRADSDNTKSNVLLLGTVTGTSQIRKVTYAESGYGSFVTGDIGDELQMTTLRRLEVAQLNTTTSATCVVKSRVSQGASLDSGTTFPLSSGAYGMCRFDGVKSARWHQVTVTLNEPAEITGLYVSLVPGGYE